MSNATRRTPTQVLIHIFKRLATSGRIHTTADFARSRTTEELARQLGSVNGTGLDEYYAARWKCHRLWG